jgi:hypothetical protein
MISYIKILTAPSWWSASHRSSLRRRWNVRDGVLGRLATVSAG